MLLLTNRRDRELTQPKNFRRRYLPCIPDNQESYPKLRIIINQQDISLRMMRFSGLSRALTTAPLLRASFCTHMTKTLLMNNLFSIDLINKNVNRAILSMAYSPGVGAVCEAITKDPSIADTMTLRGRSVAIVTDGSFFGVSGEQVQPVLDWLISQIKYYSGLDAFPFIIDKDANIEEILTDLTTCYGTVLYMDNHEIEEVPENMLLVNQRDMAKEYKCEITDLQKTAHILAFLIEKKSKGIASLEEIQDGKDYEANNFHYTEPYGVEIKDGRDIYSHSLQLHEFYQGKMQIELHFHDIHRLKPHFTEAKLRKLVKEKDVYSKCSQLSAIVTDGTSILGYGNIGPLAGLPVMEGKSLLFKLLGDVEVVPVCINPRKNIADEIKAITNLLGHFQAINLEDIKAPECFDVESGLKQLKLMPIFHDDQHGTAIVTLAGLINAVKCVDKKLSDCKIIINGAGAAGITIANLLLDYGVKDIILCDSTGSIYRGRSKNMNEMKKKIAEVTNLENKIGSLGDVIAGTDIFVGVSSEKALKGHWVSKMNKKSIVFALANPIPEIMPNDAKASGAFVYGSGRSDFENQINNSLVFPGIFRGIMQHKLREITEEMKIKTAEAIAASLTENPRPSYIIPDSLDKDVAIRISKELGKIKKSKD